MLFDNSDDGLFGFRIILLDGDLYVDRSVLVHSFNTFKSYVEAERTKVEADLTDIDYPLLATREALRYCLAFAYNDVAFPEVQAIRNGPRPDPEALKTTLDYFDASEALSDSIDWHNQRKMKEPPTYRELIYNNDIVRLKWLMEVVSPDGEWFRHASRYGRTEIVKLLLSRATDEQITHVSMHGDTTLICASIVGSTEIVKLLLPRITDEHVMQANITGYTALMLASKEGHTEIVKLLLSRVTDEHVMQVVERSNVTAYDLASTNDHTEIVELLESRVGGGAP